MPDEIGASVRARIPYQPITRRPTLRLPDGARVAVWMIGGCSDCRSLPSRCDCSAHQRGQSVTFEMQTVETRNHRARVQAS